MFGRPILPLGTYDCLSLSLPALTPACTHACLQVATDSESSLIDFAASGDHDSGVSDIDRLSASPCPVSLPHLVA